MTSALVTCTSSTRPSSPAAGDALFETDTKRIITWDGSNWRVYDPDGIAYSSGGADELQYPTGLWSSSSATYYIATSPVMHFDARILDGADAGNNPADGSAVPTWGDRSGNTTNYDASQATASQQPVFTASGPGSSPALTFDDGSSELLTLANTWDHAGALTAFSVHQVTNQYRTSPAGYPTGANAIYYEDFVNGYFFGSNAVSTGLSNYTGFNMITAIRDDSQAATLYEQGGTATLGPTTRANHMYIDRLGDAGIRHHRGTISEIMIFDSALSTADLNVIRLYITNKYGITTSAFS